MAAERLLAPRTLRTTEWDGPPPLVGAIVLTAWRVLTVAAGAGLGQYALEVCPADPDDVTDAPQVIHWREAI